MEVSGGGCAYQPCRLQASYFASERRVPHVFAEASRIRTLHQHTLQLAVHQQRSQLGVCEHLRMM